MSPEKIRIYIVDDHPFFRQGVRLYLNTLPDMEVVGEASQGEQALQYLATQEVDVVLMDLQMPGMDGVEVTRRLNEQMPDTRVLILTSYSGWDTVYQALKAGAAGYVLKDAQPQELQNAIKAVVSGGSYLGAQATFELLSRLDNEMPVNSAPTDLVEALTDRELEVLKLIARGLGNKEIGEQLVISEKTAKTHVANILQKLQVKSRTQAALYATRHGLV